MSGVDMYVLRWGRVSSLVSYAIPLRCPVLTSDVLVTGKAPASQSEA